ncbi:MAG: bifunctional [glutamate--ammonia ligase]-adenylyl-L-tyrosine phosphorylase/[glutamate--ammonia-ligase] adenylyltransferase [Gammaproteobacteria bacterium]|nr:bifunctional [glutamate--ammonia ligase]-adenylyl-L-tyrosine phosphorylase/[glutamate--ammonia-ligase] adenylyltransferase [Gammaproteobacteria bacterium]
MAEQMAWLEHPAAAGVLAALREHSAAGPLLEQVPGLAAAAARVAVGSEFAGGLLSREPGWLVALHDSGELETPPDREALARRLVLPAAQDEAAAMAALRQHRQREMLRIAWRDLCGLADVPQALRELSDLADAAIGSAVDWCTASLGARYGTPRDADGAVQPLVVLGMGKLGGRELNFSSDIDLVFLYPAAGETDGERPLANEQYFIRLGQRVVRLLDHVTADGFVYRVDMRLRPFGSSGPLALSFDAFEAYLQQHGRDWERYAYVKARAITGRAEAQHVFEEMLRPFVYRRYLDYGVFRSLREMKGMIEQEVARRDLADNVKLGPGGIREIEFVTQSFQLVRGGSDPSLRSASLLEVLPRLGRRRCLTPAAVTELLDAYGFLRRLENRLQMFADRQTHDLPAAAEERARLALAMACVDWSELAAQLAAVRGRVRRHFHDVVFVTAAETVATDAAVEGLAALWREPEGDAGLAALRRAGIEAADAAAVQERLVALRRGSLYRRMDEPSRQRLDTVMPPLLEALGRVPEPARCFERVMAIIEAVGRRSAYLALLGENPRALARLLDIVGRSGFLAAQLATWPMLLDELLDERLLHTSPDRESFREDLERRLGAQPAGDLEARLNALREFQRVGTFRVAIAEIAGELPLMRVSDRLTDIAELALELALSMAWEELVARYGQPCCRDGEQQRAAGFAIVAYGKLGGLELGYGSDLDLVFVHDDTGEEALTDGPRPIDNPVFFARLARRIIHFLSIQTTSGMLYEIDTRLRPSGQSGLLVTSLAALDRYQREEAWTWEHQALLRARAVAGGARVREGFEALRRRALVEYVRHDDLREQVAAMRQRMREALGQGGAGRFDIKQDAGGLADIEFLVQYLVLAHARAAPALLRWSDNIRQLEALASAGILPDATAEHAAEVYRRYRSRLHQLSLAGAPGIVEDTEFVEERAWVQARWCEVFPSDTPSGPGIIEAPEPQQ